MKGRGYHLLVHLAHSRVVCFGPTREGEPLVVALDDWIPAPRTPEREEALAGWARSYFLGHGPATVGDFLRWTGIPAAEARAGIAAVRPELAALDVGGVEYLMDPETPDRLAAHRAEAEALHLLPGFDEFVLGYADRSAVLDPTHAARIVPGANGVFRPTVVLGGRVVGTWSAPRGRFAVEPFDDVPLEALRARERFVGL